MYTNVFTFFLTFSLNFYSTFAQNAATSAIVENGISNDTIVAQESAPLACISGTSVGYMLIWQPNMTSLVTVGQKYNVSWEYTVLVSKKPSFVDVYVQNVNQAVTWKIKAASNISTTQTWFYWTPNALPDGRYKLRLVPDGKETYNVPVNKQPCFENGESIPSVSSTFNVMNPKGQLTDYPNQFPASNKGHIVMYSQIMAWVFVLSSLLVL